MYKPSFATYTCLGSVLLFIGWLTLRLSEHDGPGAAWTIAHIVLLLGYSALLAGGVAASAAIAPRKTKGPIVFARRSGLSLLVLGAGAFAGQLAVDLFVGFSATSQAAMDRLFDSVQSHLALQLSLYSVGPALFYVGLFVLITLLVLARGISLLRGTSALTGIALIGIAFSLAPGGIDSLWYPLGLACLAIGSLPLRPLSKT